MLKTIKPLYPKPHRNQLLKGLRPTLEPNTFHRWPGVSCSPLPQGLHQTLLPLQLKLKGAYILFIFIHFSKCTIIFIHVVYVLSCAR